LTFDQPLLSLEGITTCLSSPLTRMEVESFPEFPETSLDALNIQLS
jgi:hypothetical protein